MISQNLLDFYAALKVNNNKVWFDENRKWYESVKKEYLALTGKILEELKSLDHSLEMLQVKDCTFRINRDIRFSPDKSPYKTNLGLNFAPYGKKMMLAGYYIHIAAGQSFAGGGLYMPMAPELKKVRKEIHYCHNEFSSILQDPVFARTFGSLDRDPGTVLSRPPKEFTADDPAIEWLKLKSFTAVTTIDDNLLTSEDFVPHVIEIMKAIKPLIGFLNNALLSDENGILKAP
jgi:uncharacterized protein (TIGR02453 family)